MISIHQVCQLACAVAAQILLSQAPGKAGCHQYKAKSPTEELTGHVKTLMKYIHYRQASLATTPTGC
jgi:hypothetical protein